MNRMAKKRLVFKSQRARQGIAALEFALTLSLWTMLLLGVADGSYYLLINERVDRIAYTVTDVVTQYQTNTANQDSTLTLTKLGDIMLAAGQLMQPLAFNPATLGVKDNGTGRYPTATGYIVVTSVYQDPTQGAVVKWQYSYPPAGNGVTVPASNVGSTPANSAAVLPNGLTLNSQENVIVTEVFFTFAPLFVDPFGSKVVYRESVYKPRLSPLVTPPT
jgi:Flp pilus assembly protein TadG